MTEILLHPHDHKNKNDWQRILKFLDENLDYQNIQNVLELGAGMGNIAFYILEKNPQARAVCEDINQEYLKIIKKRNSKIETILHDINQDLPFPDNCFDLVSCLGTWHYSYVKDLEKVLREMIRVSRKYILIDFFPKYSLYTRFQKIRFPKYNPRRFSASEIAATFKKMKLKKIAKIGTRTLFPKLFPFLGRTVVFLLEKQ